MGTSPELKAQRSLHASDLLQDCRGRFVGGGIETLQRADNIGHNIGHVQSLQSQAIFARLGTALTGSTLPCSPFSFRIYIWGQYIPKNRIPELKGKSTIYSSYGELAAYSPERTLLALPTIQSTSHGWRPDCNPAPCPPPPLPCPCFDSTPCSDRPIWLTTRVRSCQLKQPAPTGYYHLELF